MADVDVCGEIITRGLVEADTRHHAAKCLDAVAAGRRGIALGARGKRRRRRRRRAPPWLPWLECDLDDDVVGRATSAAAAAAVRAAPADRWTPLEPLLRGLFHTSARRRAAAAEGRRARSTRPRPDDSTRGDSPRERPRQDRSVRGDPSTRRSRLRGGGRRRGPFSAREPVTRPNTTSSAFGSRDVAELVGVLAGDALGPSVRCAAADQLCICAGDARLEGDVASPTARSTTAARLAAAALAGGEDASAAADVGAAALKFLAAVVAHSRAARRFFSELAPVPARDGAQGAESEWRPYGRAAWLFSLVFHPRQTVRERVAKFVVYVVFAPTADIAAAHAGVPLDLERAERVYLPDALLARLRFPVPVAPLPAVARATPNVDDAKVRAVLSQDSR